MQIFHISCSSKKQSYIEENKIVPSDEIDELIISNDS